jgi:asparagine N-glycosylation enzyme membrane subunit Stt3
MVSAWGGYAFIINIIPIFVVFQLIIGRMSTHLYVAYSVFYVLGTLLAMQIPFVGFQAISSSEHLASHGVFIFLQVRLMNKLDVWYFLVQGKIVGGGVFIFFSCFLWKNFENQE